MLLYHIDQETGLLTSKPELTPKVKGVWPRHFTISKDGKQIFVVEQKLNKLQIWNIDSEDGSLTLEKEAPSENSPAVVVEFWNDVHVTFNYTDLILEFTFYNRNGATAWYDYSMLI